MEQQTNAESLEQLKSFVDEAKKKDKLDAGISGYASWVLKDSEGNVKQVGSTKNKITARGLDYILSHIVTMAWPSGAGTFNETAIATYHGTYNSSAYIVGDPDKNPFGYLALLYLYDAGNSGKQPTFSEGIGSTQYVMHRCTGTDGSTGKDMYTYNEIIGDSDTTHYTSTDHTITSNGESVNRTKVLGGKQLSEKNASSSQSNTDTGSTPHFQKVYLIFNFGSTEAVCAGTDTINNIAWMNWDSGSTAPGKCVGARLYVNPGIAKASGDTLDITYTFDLSPS